ncbi:MAG: hypothetical protein KC413_18225, partial [Anaerolineales bacterium]|nr:hypothetical protein [Anaerolineales bacterium]
FSLPSSLPPLAWRVSLRRVGWWPMAVCAVVMVSGLVLCETVWQDNDSFSTLRVLELVLPIFAGMHAAFLFSPDDEPPLELLVSAPRSPAWLLLERLLVFVALYLAIGVIGTLGQAWLTETAVFPLLARWLPPLLWLTGVAVYLTLLTRQGLLSTLLIMLIWGGFVLGGQIIIYGCSPLLPLHIFLQPDAPLVTADMYVYNRVFTLLIGGLLLMMTINMSRDEPRLLGERGPVQMRQRSPFLTDRLSVLWLALGLLFFFESQPEASWWWLALALFLLLRFMRTQRFDRGVVIGLGGATAVTYISWYAISPCNDFCHTVFAGQYALAFLLPLLIDRLLWPYGNGRFASTLVLPLAWVLVAGAATVYRDVVGPFAYSQFEMKPGETAVIPMLLIV